MIALFAAVAHAADGQVTVPLEAYEDRLRHAAAPASVAPTFAYGEAHYQGTADAQATLDLHLELHVSLAGDGIKEVPLLGPDVVVRGASVGGVAVPIARASDGSPVWRTDRTGELTIAVDGLVAPSGPKGSPQYEFGVIQTPITSLDLTFPRPDLRPVVQGAVSAELTSTATSTRLVASLSSTDRISLVGLRELGPTESTEARLYAETSHLLAVDEHEVDLFTVVRYDILYASAHRFEVFVPEGLTVVSADGEGPFSYQLVPQDGGTLVVGETATPMRSKYELSLELSRELPDAAVAFALPSARGVERESGWVGVEAPGRVRLEPIAQTSGLSTAPIAELPDELRSASVSPLLEGFRLEGPATLELVAHPLPEVEARSERVDQVEARTVLSSNGRALTEISLTLRNRMRPGLAVALPEGATLVRAMRDGQIVTPSRASTGEIVVPLRRSAPDLPFVVQLVVEQDLGPLGSFGRARLALPSFDWPAAEVSWDLEFPAGGHWFDPIPAVAGERLAGHGHWLADDAGRGLPATPTAQVALNGSPDATYHRYWVPAGQVLSLSAWHVPWALYAATRAASGLAWMLLLPLSLGYLGWRLVRALRR